ncbi:hypothetical protein CHLNCDRAFT_56500 [Chlorella variabilis]|uniref:SAP domain-containing protein n=1 Tax=Chlorella variabilis TaxID=554065 RepID=E1Z2I3_CHLVA|nr:hypothetical protein CHLNCDRAFT_56500 [Chlorella variabilis]EFN59666.1 hypothetical protein CHLNCDRAFT_56500 [Chlorella variabilis]|eukprot:XP_005851768.1 hypothetical protein CHLNCDRAFT_56500 [Chlorella variabilis]
MPSTDWVHELKVVELKDECKKRGLAVSGKKADLIERLESFLKENEKSPSEEPVAEEAEESPAAAAVEEAEAEEEPAAAVAEEEEDPVPAAAADEEPAAMDAEQAADPEPQAEPEPEPEPAAAEAEQPAAAMEEEAPAPAAEPEPAAAAPEVAAPASVVAADVDLDYGEESDGDGAPAPAEQQQQEEPEESGKRKREEEAGAARRGGGRERAAAAVAAAGGSAERPSKVPRSGSGFSLGTAEKGEALAPEEVPVAGEPATRALRIDGFVRPFTERQVRELLSETGQVLALWMPSIKTHCYAVFESKAQAEETRKATYHLQWPATNPKRLAPRFVPLTEAETAIGTGAGNPDFRLKRTEEDGEEEQAAVQEAVPAVAADPKPEQAAVDKSQREWNRNRRSPSPPLEGVRDLREMLSRRISGRSSDAAAGAAAAGAPAPAGAPRTDQDLPPGIGRPGERRGSRDLERRLSGRGAPPRQEDRVLTLDELFKKTTSKPCIYWLPLTDEQVAEKKRKAAEAAAAAAAAVAAPAAGAAQQPAENGTAAATS